MNINPFKWYGIREVESLPPHFIKCQSKVSPDTLLWVETKLIGRYCVIVDSLSSNGIFESRDYIFFEDPSEATAYELRWASSH